MATPPLRSPRGTRADREATPPGRSLQILARVLKDAVMGVQTQVPEQFQHVWPQQRRVASLACCCCASTSGAHCCLDARGDGDVDRVSCGNARRHQQTTRGHASIGLRPHNSASRFHCALSVTETPQDPCPLWTCVHCDRPTGGPVADGRRGGSCGPWGDWLLIVVGCGSAIKRQLAHNHTISPANSYTGLRSFV